MNLAECMYDYRTELSRSITIGKCTCCNEEIPENEAHYELDDDVILHDDCLVDYMMKYRKS